MWKEGFDQRISRKQNGFKHDKIEWDVITARWRILSKFDKNLLCFVSTIFTREEEMFDKKFEDLQLPTSRLVRRRRHLGRVYEQVTLIMVSSFW